MLLKADEQLRLAIAYLFIFMSRDNNDLRIQCVLGHFIAQLPRSHYVHVALWCS